MKNSNFSTRLILVSLALLLAMPSTMAYDFEVDGIYYNEAGRNLVLVTFKDEYFNSYSGNITVPSTVTHSGRTYTVYGIGDNAFRNCSQLTDITIPNSVVTIGITAFYDCSSLKEAKIGNGVTEIGEYAFFGCNEMTSLSLGDHLQTIHDNAFYACSQLTSVVFPNSLVTIGNSAFCFCRALSHVVIGNGVKTIGDYAFHECMAMSDLVIGNSVVYIGTNAFYSCRGLESVKIPDTVETIGDCAFLQCQSLTEITIGSNVKSLGYGVFAGCSQLRSITCKAVTPPSFVVDESWMTFNSIVYEQGTLYVPETSIERYRSAYIWDNFANIQAIIERIPGDVNGDGEVNIMDVDAVINVILSNQVNSDADVNDDGEVNILDVDAIINIILFGPAPTTDHEYVDLGLPSGTLWATCNIGANSPEEFGDYFAWGETAPKEDYNWNTYKWCDGNQYAIKKYDVWDGKTELEPEDDAAYVNWGSSWRMPSKDQVEELVNECTWTWTSQNGVKGKMVTGPNGNSIFLPAAGRHLGKSFIGADSGYYWLRTLSESYDWVANYLYISSSTNDWSSTERRFGHSVRAVRVSQN